MRPVGRDEAASTRIAEAKVTINKDELRQQVRNTNAHGSARLLNESEAASVNLLTSKLEAAPILLGRCVDPQFGTYARYDGDGHILTIAPTGAGKTAGAVMPNHFYPGSMLIIDPKGNVPAMGAHQRLRMGQEVQILDPWGVTKLPKQFLATVNPFDLLSATSESTLDDARVLAAGLIIEEEGKNRYFSDIARMLVTAFLVHIVTAYPRSAWNVTTLVEWGFAGHQEFFGTPVTDGKPAKLGKIAELRGNHAFEGWLSPAASMLQSMSLNKELWGSIFATIQRSLDFLRSPCMKRIMASNSSGFRFAELKQKPMTVYIVVPPERLEAYGRWLRLMLSQAIIEVSREKNQLGNDKRVLFILDEFPALQRLEIIETAIGLMRGYGIKLWPIIQDMSQLKDLYPQRWASFIANAGVLQVFNINDVDTAEYISKRMGMETRVVTGLHVNPEDLQNAQTIERAVMTPDELMRLPSDQQILFYQGQHPFIVKKMRHFEDDDLKKHFDPDPMR